ncbi:MAG: hypothetical protein HQK51_06895 [Oligoflexia bacterium]|nr:hypothetical protein [Oligoflexia bacterium]
MIDEKDKKEGDINSRTVYISNLSYDCGKDDLKDIFSEFGTVKSVKIIIDFKTMISKGMAFVEMKDAKSAKMAIKSLNGTIIDDRTVKTQKATPMKNKSVKTMVPKREFEVKKTPIKKYIPKTRRTKPTTGLKKMLGNLKILSSKKKNHV